MARPRELLLLLPPLLTALGARGARTTAPGPRRGSDDRAWATGLPPEVVWCVLGLVPGPVLVAWTTERQFLQVLRPGADPPEFTVQGSAKQSRFWPSGDRLLIYHLSGGAAGRPPGEGALLWRIWAGPSPELAMRSPEIVLDAQVFPAGDRVALLAFGGLVVICDAASGEALHTMDVRGHPCQMRLLGVSRLATWLSYRDVASMDAAILWDFSAGLSGQELRQPRGPVWKLEASPRGSKFVTFYTHDDVVYVWDATTALLLRELRTAAGTCRDARIDDDAARIAVEAAGTLFVWDGASGEPRTVRGDHRSLLLFPDGRRVAAINSSELAVWDAGSGERLVQLKTDAWLSARLADRLFDFRVDIEVSPCGRVLAACSHSFSDPSRFVLAVWDVRSGRLMLTRESAVVSSPTHPNGRCELAVASMSTMAGELLG